MLSRPLPASKNIAGTLQPSFKMKTPVTIGDAIQPTQHARILVQADEPFTVAHCSPGWFFLTGHRFQETSGKSFFDFASASAHVQLRLKARMSSGKQVMSKMTIVPADASETPFQAAISATPVYANDPTTCPKQKHTHVCVRIIKLVTTCNELPRVLLSQLNAVQRKALGAIMVVHPSCRKADTAETDHIQVQSHQRSSEGSLVQ